MEKLLEETKMLNWGDPIIQALISQKGWAKLGEKDRIHAIYNFVRDDIRFGYNKSDNMSATQVLHDGYGQCNTKGTLFMALLRAVGIPCRIHAFYVDKIIKKELMKKFYYKRAPKEILHSWVEIFFKGKWLNIEGFILDKQYIAKLQNKFKDCENFCGYAVAVDNLQKPPIDWEENDTYVQKNGITKDLGFFDSPDEMFAKYKQKLGCFKSFMYKNFVRKSMNRKVDAMRNS